MLWLSLRCAVTKETKSAVVLLHWWTLGDVLHERKNKVSVSYKILNVYIPAIWQSWILSFWLGEGMASRAFYTTGGENPPCNPEAVRTMAKRGILISFHTTGAQSPIYVDWRPDSSWLCRVVRVRRPVRRHEERMPYFMDLPPTLLLLPFWNRLSKWRVRSGAQSEYASVPVCLIEREKGLTWVTRPVRTSHQQRFMNYENKPCLPICITQSHLQMIICCCQIFCRQFLCIIHTWEEGSCLYSGSLWALLHVTHIRPHNPTRQ